MKDILILLQLPNVLYVKTQLIILKKIHLNVMNVQLLKEQKVVIKIL
jgi:hypothetical protein